jgi:hypothetical protein
MMCVVDSHVSVMSWVKRHWLPILWARVARQRHHRSMYVSDGLGARAHAFQGPPSIWHGGSGWQLGENDARRQLSKLPWEVEVEAARVIPAPAHRPIRQQRMWRRLPAHSWLADRTRATVTSIIQVDPATGAGGDNGIAATWNRREISVSSYDDPSHYLHPHPYIGEGRAWGRRRHQLHHGATAAFPRGRQQVAADDGVRGVERGVERAAAVHLQRVDAPDSTRAPGQSHTCLSPPPAPCPALPLPVTRRSDPAISAENHTRRPAGWLRTSSRTARGPAGLSSTPAARRPHSRAPASPP